MTVTLLVLGLQAQDSRNAVPTFRAAVDAIEVDVFVTDNQGRFVRDLSRDDFEIVEDGRPQTIQSFSLVDLPADDAPATAPAPALSVPPDVHSNTRREGRLYVILMDSPSTHSPPGVSGGGTYTVLTRRVMREFVEQAVGPNDLVAVVHTHGTSTDAQTFTTDKQLVFASIERYGRGLSGDLPELTSGHEKGTRHLTTYRTIEDLSKRLGTVGGRRKSVIWVGAQLLFAPPGLWSEQ